MPSPPARLSMDLSALELGEVFDREARAANTALGSMTLDNRDAPAEPILAESIANKDSFMSLFHPPTIDRHPFSPKTEMSLFILRSDGGGFDYTNMYRQLGNASISYVLSRSRFDDITPDVQHEKVKSVQRSFRNAELNDGEGGELLLYCFLESHLGAPKILSKMELKTARDDYVKGADGLHLLESSPGTFHLILGESKMIGDSTEPRSSFRSAIAQALISVKKVAANGLLDEVQLIDSNLMKESFSEEKLIYLKSILVPRRTGAPKRLHAFGIFVGFEIDITKWPLIDMSSDEIEQRIHGEVMEMVETRYDYIKKKITDHNLAGYHFYLYAVPFIKDFETDIDKVRKRIIEEI